MNLFFISTEQYIYVYNVFVLSELTHILIMF